MARCFCRGGLRRQRVDSVRRCFAVHGEALLSASVRDKAMGCSLMQGRSRREGGFVALRVAEERGKDLPMDGHCEEEEVRRNEQV